MDKQIHRFLKELARKGNSQGRNNICSTPNSQEVKAWVIFHCARRLKALASVSVAREH